MQWWSYYRWPPGFRVPFIILKLTVAQHTLRQLLRCSNDRQHPCVSIGQTSSVCIAFVMHIFTIISKLFTAVIPRKWPTIWTIGASNELQAEMRESRFKLSLMIGFAVIPMFKETWHPIQILLLHSDHGGQPTNAFVFIATVVRAHVHLT